MSHHVLLHCMCASGVKSLATLGRNVSANQDNAPPNYFNIVGLVERDVAKENILVLVQMLMRQTRAHNPIEAVSCFTDPGARNQ